MAYTPQNPNGQATMANSAPVVIASNQSAVPISDGGGSVTVDGTVAVSGTVPVSQSGNWAARVVGNGGATVDSTVGPAPAPANALAVSGLYNNTPPAPTTGQALAQQLDQAGNNRVMPSVAMATLSGWTSATALNATQTIFSNSGAPAVLVHLVQGTTISGGAITFEVSYDNTNWVTIPADAVHDPSATSSTQISLPYTLVASTNKPFLLMSKGWQGLRIKLSTAITGSATVTPNYALLPTIPACADTQPVVGTAPAGTATASAGNPLVAAGIVATSPPSYTTGQSNNLSLSAESALRSTLIPSAAAGLGGVLVSRDVDLDNAALTVVKASPGQLYGYYFYNTTAGVVYVKFYNATSGTLGTGTPVMTIPVPAGGGANVGFPYPISFSTGICVGAGTGVGDADNTDPGANALIANIFYL